MSVEDYEPLDSDTPIWVNFVLTTAGCIALLPAFALWCGKLGAQRIRDWDATASTWCRRPTQRHLWRFFSRLGDGWLYMFWYLILRESGKPNRIAPAVFLAWGMCAALKSAFRRKRQNPIVRRRRLLMRIPSWSFPSQHAACAVAFAFVLWPNPVCAILAVAICWSRVALGAHYLCDVLAGIGVGVLAGVMA